MKLSTKGRYGLKAMYYLAKFQNEKQVISISELSKLTQTSDAYLEKIMSKLKKNLLVKSYRGASGGYVLARDAKKITIGEVLNVLEDGLLVSDCTTKCTEKTCPNKNIFKFIDCEINKVLNKITLKQMVEGKENE